MTAPYNADSLAVIAHMIAAAKEQITAVGTLTDRFPEPVGGGMCQIDPSAQSVPVKIFKDVPCRSGDRVGLVKLGSDWTVLGSFGTSTLLAPVSAVFGFGGITSMTSATAVDMPGSPRVTLTKRFTWSWVDIDLRVGTFVTVNGTGYRAGVSVNGADYDVFTHYHNTATLHNQYSGRIQITDLPAGTFDVVARWRRTAGTGDVRVDTNDNVYLTATEIAPS